MEEKIIKQLNYKENLLEAYLLKNITNESFFDFHLFWQVFWKRVLYLHTHRILGMPFSKRKEGKNF
eukprot:UN17763